MHLTLKFWVAPGVLAAGVLWNGGVATWAQDAGGMPTEAEAPEARTSEAAPTAVEFDASAFLTSQDVLPQTVSGTVWQFQPQPGRRLLLLPFTVNPVSEATELDEPPVQVQGGRFLAWRIQPDEGAGGGGMRSRPPGLPGGFQMPGPYGGAGRGGFGGMRPPRRAGGGADLPQNAPTFAREVTLTPDGQVRWSMDRAIPGGEVGAGGGGNLYALKIRPDLLGEQRPQQPRMERGQAGGDRQAMMARRREEQMQLREAQRAFRELMAQVRSLPETFEAPQGERLWALYDVPAMMRSLTLEVPGMQPWSMEPEALETLRSVASGSGGYTQVSQLMAMTRDGHPLTQRLIAEALVASGMVGQVQTNDPLYGLLRALIGSSDEQARATIIRALATAEQPTPGTVALLHEAAPVMTPEMRLVALRGLLNRGRGAGAPDASQALATVNTTLADPNGPDAGEVLRALAESIERPDNRTLATYTRGVRFEGLTEARRDEAIAYVIRAAGTQPLAAAWLNYRLLGSADPATARRTLELLSRAGAGNNLAGPVGRELLRLVFGEGNGGSGGGLDLTLSAPIPLTSSDHALFRGLQSADPEVRKLAWRSLGRFTPHDAGNRYRGRQDQGTQDPVSQLVRRGVTEQPTPEALAVFLSRAEQRNERATSGLVQMAAAGRGPGAEQAARVLMGSGRNMAEALQSMPANLRMSFAEAVYRSTQQRAPMAAGLITDPAERASVVRWFADQVGAGRLPSAAEWAEAYGGESRLLEAAASNNPLLANAGVAGLVATAGGDAATAAEMAQRFLSLSDRSSAAVAEAWSKAKEEVYARSLADLAGDYRLTVNQREAAGRGAPYGMPPLPPEAMQSMPPEERRRMMEAARGEVQQSVNVGVVALTVDGSTAYLGNQTVGLTVPEERVALRLSTPSSLKNFPNDPLAMLPLEQVQGPIDLLPREGGVWRGTAELPGGESIEVVLEPVGP